MRIPTLAPASLPGLCLVGRCWRVAAGRARGRIAERRNLCPQRVALYELVTTSLKAAETLGRQMIEVTKKHRAQSHRVPSWRRG
jgi:hypothetical protein